ncbi:hypothetical protein D9M68_252900 [compost metagenome]
MLLQVVEAHAGAHGEAALVELAVHRYPFHVLAEEQARVGGHADAQQVGVFQLAAQAVAPGEVGDVAVVLAAVRLRVARAAGVAAVGRVGAAAEDEAAAVAQVVVALRHVVPLEGDLGGHLQAGGAQHVGEQVDAVDLQLGLLEAVVAAQVGVLADRLRLRAHRTHALQGGGEHVVAVALHRDVRRVAQLAAHRPAGQGGGGADAVQADVLRVLPEGAGGGGAERQVLVQLHRVEEGRATPGDADRNRTPVAGLRGDVGRARMDVHGVEAELGVDGIHQVAQRDTPLSGVLGVLALDQRQARAGGEAHRVADVGQRGGHGAAARMGGDDGLGDRPVVAAALDDGGLPLELVEGLQRQAVAEAEAAGDHPYRQQRFLDLGARAAQGRHVQRVDLVDALDEQAFAPVQHLAAETHLQRVLVEVVGVVDVGVEQVDALVLLQVLEAVVGQRLALVAVGLVAEVHVLVFQRLVVPALDAQQTAHLVLAHRQLGEELGDGGEAVATVVVEVAAVGVGAAEAIVLADHLAVEAAVQLVVALLGAPAAAEGKRGVEAAGPAVADLEVECLGVPGSGSQHAQQDRAAQRVADETGGV